MMYGVMQHVVQCAVGIMVQCGLYTVDCYSRYM